MFPKMRVRFVLSRTPSPLYNPVFNLSDDFQQLSDTKSGFLVTALRSSKHILTTKAKESSTKASLLVHSKTL